MSSNLLFLTSLWKLSLFDVLYVNMVDRFLGRRAKISSLSPFNSTSYSLSLIRLIILTFLKWQLLPVRAARTRSWARPFLLMPHQQPLRAEIKTIEPRCVLTRICWDHQTCVSRWQREISRIFSARYGRDPVLDAVVFIAAHFLCSSPAKLFI